MSVGHAYSLWISAGLTAVILLINARVILETLRGILTTLARRARG